MFWFNVFLVLGFVVIVFLFCFSSVFMTGCFEHKEIGLANMLFHILRAWLRPLRNVLVDKDLVELRLTRKALLYFASY